jgi:hypothetical protein
LWRITTLVTNRTISFLHLTEQLIHPRFVDYHHPAIPFCWKYQYNKYMFNFIDIYSFIPVSSCLGRDHSVLLWLRAYNAVKTTLGETNTSNFGWHIDILVFNVTECILGTIIYKCMHECNILDIKQKKKKRIQYDIKSLILFPISCLWPCMVS